MKLKGSQTEKKIDLLEIDQLPKPGQDSEAVGSNKKQPVLREEQVTTESQEPKSPLENKPSKPEKSGNKNQASSPNPLPVLN